MPKNIFISLLIVTVCSLQAAEESSSSVTTKPEFDRLSCENLENPIGLDQTEPLFSWTMKNKGYNQAQSASHVLLASTPALLKPGKADFWDSGKTISRQSAHVMYNGKSLQATTRYWWTVKVWNQDRLSSNWSQPQCFEMGLLGESGWKDAQWISLQKDTRDSQYRFREKKTERMKEPKMVASYPTGYFRKEIEVIREIESARAYICALGYYELYLNGEKVGDHVLDPAPTSYDKRSLYVTYDITEQMQDSLNTVGIILGNSFYGQNLGFATDLSYGKPAVRLQIRIEYTDGNTKTVISDSSWKASTGPIVFDNPYAGETYDARFEMPGWNKNGFINESWQPAQVVQPEVAHIAAQTMPPSRAIKVLPPIGVFQGANGNWIVDFGQVIAGWVRIRPRSSPGTPILVHTAEALTRKGDAIHPGSLGKFATGWDQTDIYICNGNESASWEPRFTYNSFRYAEIEGFSVKPTPESVQAVVVYSDLRRTGSFSSSDPLLNHMVEISEWTVLDNLHGYPEDCPAREKCGWLGDAHATAQFNLYAFDIASLFEKYTHDIITQLRPAKGKFSEQSRTFQVPPMIAPGKRTSKVAELDWGIAEIYVPWYVYLHTGHRRVIDENYPEMKELVQYYLTLKNKDGILETGQGDWCPPGWDRQGRFPGPMECHPHISANAYFYDILGIMIRISEMNKDLEFVSRLKKERKSLLEAFNRNYRRPIGDDGGFWYGSQTATVMALQFGLVPGSVREAVIKGLLYDIVIVKGGHHSTGIHGNRYLYTLLNNLGYEDLSYSVLTHPEFPSQGYIVNAGLTTWPERQWEWSSGIEWDRSLNHPMQAGFAALFYESVAGIRPDPDAPGFARFFIEPTIFEQLDRAGAHIDSPYGKISSYWSKTSDGIRLDVEIPFNTRARIRLPAKAGSSVKVIKSDGSGSRTTPYKEIGIPLGSGSYSLVFGF